MQLPRFIAVPLIQSVLAGHDPAAWLFPAIIDIVVAVAGVPLIVLTWTRPGLATWVYALLWLSLSIFDHASAVTAFAIAGMPTVFAEMGGGGAAVPALQTVLDVALFVMLCQRGVRAHFLERA
jgi:hypothetical protein